jgi:hypothetical protein
LKSKAEQLGWSPERIRVLDRDLGQSGARMDAKKVDPVTGRLVVDRDILPHDPK